MSYETIPPEISEAYGLGNAPRLQRLGGGVINMTLKAHAEDGRQLIIQKLNPVFGAEMSEDYDVVSRHLIDDGWEVPEVAPNPDGEPSYVDSDGSLWRAFGYIENDGQSSPVVQPAHYGALLGTLHASLASLEYAPKAGIPYFHDSNHHAERLERTIPVLPGADTRAFAGSLLNTFYALPTMPDAPTQLIHGDPRADNMLFRNGRPFTFIDWDTVMRGNVLLDVGDMMRSVAKNTMADDGTIRINDLTQLSSAYAAATRSDLAEGHALTATQRIAAELAMRFAADHESGAAGYFDWDPTNYLSRIDHNVSRAQVQLSIVQQIQQYKDAA